MNINFLWSGSKCRQKLNDPPLVEREQAANTHNDISLSEIIITNPQEISKENGTGPAIKDEDNKMLAFGFFSVWVSGVPQKLRFFAWVGLGVIMEDRLLPHDYDSEGMLLAALFCPGGMQKATRLISPDDFYSESVKLIFSKMLDFHNSWRGFTISIVDQAFEGHTEYTNIRGALDMLVPVTAETVPYFAGIVRELADRRRAIKATHEAYEKLFDLSVPINQAMEFLSAESLNLCGGSSS